MDFKIKAFGACMIGGYPHRFEDSGFHQAMERLRKETSQKIIPSVYTLGGFPVPRVLKHLQPRCLADHPDVVVVQFGSSDLVVPVRKKRHTNRLAAGTAVPATPATLAYQLRWRLRGLIGDVFQLNPVTSPALYLSSMSRMVEAIAASQAIPVVLSPFVFGAQRSNRIARQCVPMLRQAVECVPMARYMDVYSALDRFPRREILLSDGTHLTLKGQAILGECLFTALSQIVREN